MSSEVICYRSDFTNGKPRIATEADCTTSWNCRPASQSFRCYLCGHHFRVGDVWRFVWATHVGCINFMVCESCDGPDVLERWKAHVEDGEKRFWWM